MAEQSQGEQAQTSTPQVTEEQGNKPVKTFKTGTIEVCIWSKVVNKDGRDLTFYNLTWHRDYKDKNGEWKSTNSLDLPDIPKLQVLLAKAYEWRLFEAKK